LGNDGALV